MKTIIWDINGKHTIETEAKRIISIDLGLSGVSISYTLEYEWGNPYGYPNQEKTTEEYLYNIPPGKKCEYCLGSGEKQEWNMDKKMMETINNGCTYCNGTGYIDIKD